MHRTHAHRTLSINVLQAHCNWRPHNATCELHTLDIISPFWSQDPYNRYVVLVVVVGSIQKFCLKIAKIENSQSWKLSKLKVAKIEGCQNIYNNKGPFNDYVGITLPFFDHVPTSTFTILTLNMDKNWYLLTTYPPFPVPVVKERSLIRLDRSIYSRDYSLFGF